MEILTEYSFTRPSKSQYTPVVEAIKNGAKAVRLTRGDGVFSEDATTASVQGGVSQQMRNAGLRARTFVEDENNVVVSTWAEGQGPAKRQAKKRPARQTAAA